MSCFDEDVQVPRQVPRDAMAAMTSGASVREQVFDCIGFSDGLTPDEVAHRLAISVLTVRPRCSELVRRGRLVDSGERRANASGRLAKVLVVARDNPAAKVAA